MRARSPVYSQPFTKVCALASGLFQYPGTTLGARTSNSPTPSESGSNRSRSTTGAAEPTESARTCANSGGRKGAPDDVAVNPNPLPPRALGNAAAIRPTRSGAIGAPPYITQRTPLVSISEKFG